MEPDLELRLPWQRVFSSTNMYKNGARPCCAAKGREREQLSKHAIEDRPTARGLRQGSHERVVRKQSQKLPTVGSVASSMRKVCTRTSDNVKVTGFGDWPWPITRASLRGWLRHSGGSSQRYRCACPALVCARGSSPSSSTSTVTSSMGSEGPTGREGEELRLTEGPGDM